MSILDNFKFDAETEIKDLLLMAKIAEAAERYEDMCEFMKALAEKKQQLGKL